jgi:hypothetical protein
VAVAVAAVQEAVEARWRSSSFASRVVGIGAWKRMTVDLAREASDLAPERRSGRAAEWATRLPAVESGEGRETEPPRRAETACGGEAKLSIKKSHMI